MALIVIAVWIYNYGKYLNFNNDSIAIAEERYSDSNMTDEEINPNLEYEKKLYRPVISTSIRSEQKLYSPKPSTPAHTKPKFKCDGRQHCSQMHSYGEAKFFLNNCPNTKMDGDHDGIPCERQFGRYE